MFPVWIIKSVLISQRIWKTENNHHHVFQNFYSNLDIEFVNIVHASIQLCSKQSCPEKNTTTWRRGGGGLFIEHLTVHIWACHCMEIMAESAIIIIIHLLPSPHCAWVVIFGEGCVLLNLAGWLCGSNLDNASFARQCRRLSGIWCWVWRCYSSLHGLRHWVYWFYGELDLV